MIDRKTFEKVVNDELQQVKYIVTLHNFHVVEDTPEHFFKLTISFEDFSIRSPSGLITSNAYDVVDLKYDIINFFVDKVYFGFVVGDSFENLLDILRDSFSDRINPFYVRQYILKRNNQEHIPTRTLRRLLCLLSLVDKKFKGNNECSD